MLLKQFNNVMIGHFLCAEDYLNKTIPFKIRIVTWPLTQLTYTENVNILLGREY